MNKDKKTNKDNDDIYKYLVILSIGVDVFFITMLLLVLCPLTREVIQTNYNLCTGLSIIVAILCSYYYSCLYYDKKIESIKELMDKITKNKKG